MSKSQLEIICHSSANANNSKERLVSAAGTGHLSWYYLRGTGHEGLRNAPLVQKRFKPFSTDGDAQFIHGHGTAV